MEEETRAAAPTAGTSVEGALGNLGQKFEAEIHKLKGLALGTVFGIVRDMITGSAPPQLSSQLAEIIDSATAKLGGQPIHGPVLDMFGHGSSEQPQAQHSHRFAAMDAAGPID
jgi:hypothetical protein